MPFSVRCERIREIREALICKGQGFTGGSGASALRTSVTCGKKGFGS